MEEMNEVSYIAFILAYQLLTDKLREEFADADVAYTYCMNIAKDFIHSKYNDLRIGLYECLYVYLDKTNLNDEKFLK